MSGRLDKAIDMYEKAVDLDPHDWPRFRDLGILYEEVNIYPSAVSALEKALKINRHDSSPRFYLGRVKKKMCLYEAAERELIQVQAATPSNMEVARELSLVYEGMGKWGAALQQWGRFFPANAPSSDWARTVYLSFMAKDGAGMDNGLAGLRKNGVSPDDFRFYSDLKDLPKAPDGTPILFDKLGPVFQPFLEALGAHPSGTVIQKP